MFKGPKCNQNSGYFANFSAKKWSCFEIFFETENRRALKFGMGYCIVVPHEKWYKLCPLWSYPGSLCFHNYAYKLFKLSIVLFNFQVSFEETWLGCFAWISEALNKVMYYWPLTAYSYNSKFKKWSLTSSGERLKANEPLAIKKTLRN